jgi:hypothetical protein
MNIPSWVLLAISVAIQFLKSTIKNPTSQEAAKLKAILTVLVAEIQDILSSL